MYHFFINFGIFPIQLAQASLIHIFGNTLSPSILLSSFFTTISKREEKVLFESYQGISFERLSVIDVLSTYGIRSCPTTVNELQCNHTFFYTDIRIAFRRILLNQLKSLTKRLKKSIIGRSF